MGKIKVNKGVTITMPFYHLNNKSIEVEIISNNITYSEIGSTHYGLQVNDHKNYDKIKKLCMEISEKVKELNYLTS